MDDKYILNGKEITDLDQLSQIAGGEAVEGEDGLYPGEAKIMLDWVTYAKNRQGDTLEKIITGLQKSRCTPDRKEKYAAIIRKEWDNL